MPHHEKDRRWIELCWDAHADRLEDYNATALRDESFDTTWKCCWCCGSEANRLQKCHIVPRSMGGSDKAINLVPLCPHCHDEMPDVSCPSFFWEWLRKQQNPLSPLGLGRFYEAFESGLAAARRAKQSGLDLDVGLALEKYRENLKERVTVHFGQRSQGPYIKPSSVEWAIVDAVKQSSEGQLSLLDQ